MTGGRRGREAPRGHCASAGGPRGTGAEVHPAIRQAAKAHAGSGEYRGEGPRGGGALFVGRTGGGTHLSEPAHVVVIAG